MREIKTIRTILLAAAVAALGLTAAGAPVATPVLGSEGEVYRLVRAATEAGDPYLILDVQRPDGSTESLTVPETEGAGGENSPHLIYENASRTVYLTWEERFNHIHSLIRLVGFQDGTWTDVIEVSEGSFSFKGEPRLAATQDSFVVGDGEDSTRTVTRTVLHVVWVEEHSEGQFVAYAPVTLLDGHYVGQRRIFDLSSILSGAEPLPTDLWQLSRPTVAAAADDHSVVVGLIDPHTGRVASLRITMLPGELSMVADELRSHLIDVGARHEWQSPEGLQRLADELRSHLIDVGHRLDPQILRHVADGLRSHLIDVGARYAPSDVRRMAGDLRSHLIDVGFRLNDSGLRQATAAALSQAVIEVAAVGEGDEASLATQVARVTVVDDWSRPAEALRDSVLLVSRSGNAALLHWTEGQAVLYRETSGDEWSPVVRLPLRDAFGADEALGLLQNRIRNR
jgi:hypothetical protein